MLANPFAVDAGGRDRAGRECVGVVGVDENACIPEEFRNAAATKRCHRGAATQRFGDHQAIRLVPPGGDQRDRRRADHRDKVTLGEVTDVADPVVELRGDASREVLAITDRSGDPQPPAGEASRLDREVRTLLRHQSSEPGEVVAALADGPAVGVDPVGYHRNRPGHVTPRRCGVGADGDAVGRWRHRHRRLQPRRRRRVQRGDHRCGNSGRHGDRQIVQAVVVDDVVVLRPFGEIEHE